MINEVIDATGRVKPEEKYNVPVWEQCLLTVEKACAVSGIGMNVMRNIIKQPYASKFTFQYGDKILVKRQEFLNWISSTERITSGGEIY